MAGDRIARVATPQATVTLTVEELNKLLDAQNSSLDKSPLARKQPIIITVQNPTPVKQEQEGSWYGTIAKATLLVGAMAVVGYVAYNQGFSNGYNLGVTNAASICGKLAEYAQEQTVTVIETTKMIGSGMSDAVAVVGGQVSNAGSAIAARATNVATTFTQATPEQIASFVKAKAMEMKPDTLTIDFNTTLDLAQRAAQTVEHVAQKTYNLFLVASFTLCVVAINSLVSKF